MRLPALLTGTALSCLLLAGCNDVTAKDLTLDLAARHETGIFDRAQRRSQPMTPGRTGYSLLTVARPALISISFRRPGRQQALR